MIRSLTSVLSRLNRSCNHQKKKFVGSSADSSVEKTPITAQLWQQRDSVHEVQAIQYKDVVSVEAINQIVEEILEKKTSESRLSVTYSFQSHHGLRDLYIDNIGNVLLGKLLEDLDAFAGNIAFKHVSNSSNQNKIALVTASVDKITQNKATITTKDDLIMTGQVAWVGKSSMDIIIELHRQKHVENSNKIPQLYESGAKSLLLSSLFTFVARDLQTNKAVEINRLITETPQEERIFNERQKVVLARKNSTSSLTAENSICQKSLSQLIERGQAHQDMPALAHPNAVLIKATALENCFICQPQNVNMAGRVFGGFLMHRAYDLAISTCYTFAGSHPRFIEVDEIVFKRPVDIGDLIRLKSRVIYASDDPIRPTAQVEVICQVVRPERASSFMSNSFNFVFGFEDAVTLRRLLPSNQEEATTLLTASKWMHPDYR